MWRLRYPQLRQGLVGAWCPSRDAARGTVRLTDHSPYRNHGSLTNMDPATDWTISPGAGGGYALDFDGSNDYLQVPHSSALMPSALTLSCWCRPTTATNNGVLFKGPLSESQGVYSLSVATAGVGWYFRLNGSTSEGNGQESGGTVTLNKWTHFLGSWDGTTMALYVDNILIGASAYSTSLTANTNALHVGVYYSASFTFNGAIDDVRIYQCGLSAEKVAQLYRLGRGGAYALEYVPIGKAGAAAPVTRNDNLLLLGVS